jgi:hypothetical protein
MADDGGLDAEAFGKLIGLLRHVDGDALDQTEREQIVRGLRESTWVEHRTCRRSQLSNRSTILLKSKPGADPGGPIESNLAASHVSESKQKRATLAQLVERLIRNQQVAGSIPAGGSIFSSSSRVSIFRRGLGADAIFEAFGRELGTVPNEKGVWGARCKSRVHKAPLGAWMRREPDGKVCLKSRSIWRTRHVEWAVGHNVEIGPFLNGEETPRFWGRIRGSVREQSVRRDSRRKLFEQIQPGPSAAPKLHPRCRASHVTLRYSPARLLGIVLEACRGRRMAWAL